MHWGHGGGDILRVKKVAQTFNMCVDIHRQLRASPSLVGGRGNRFLELSHGSIRVRLCASFGGGIFQTRDPSKAVHAQERTPRSPRKTCTRSYTTRRSLIIRKTVTLKASGTNIDISLIVTVQVDPGMTYGSSEVYKAPETYLSEKFACLSGMNGVTFRVEVYDRWL